MKTNRIFQQKTLRLMSLFVGAITVISCGSYQNSSYYDDDGVYGPDNSVKTKQVVQNETTSGSYSNAYAQQFKSMKEDFGPTEVLTDVDNYKSAPDTVYVKENGTRYGGWGENLTNNNIVIVNDNWGWNNWGWNGWYGNNWGMNGWGWNGWYGNNWGMNGWGWNGWYGTNWGMNGWGWNGWYGNNWGMNGWYGNGWYGGGRNVVINNGPRGGYINNNGNSGRLTSGRVGNSTGSPRTQIGQTRGTSIGTPRTQVSDPRTFNPRGNTNAETPRAPISDPRTYTPRGNTNNGTPRTQTSEPRTYTPRNDTPRTISTPRSSDFGGGRSSGGFGGGGSTGGGGRSGGGGRGGR